MALLEAMAHGLPVIATPVGGIPEAVKDGETGLLVAPGNVDALAQAIASVTHNPALRDEMGQRVRAFVSEHFSVASAMSRMLDLWRGVKERS